jgi:hypothetical protein
MQKQTFVSQYQQAQDQLGSALERIRQLVDPSVGQFYVNGFNVGGSLQLTDGDCLPLGFAVADLNTSVGDMNNLLAFLNNGQSPVTGLYLSHINKIRSNVNA